MVVTRPATHGTRRGGETTMMTQRIHASIRTEVAFLGAPFAAC